MNQPSQISSHPGTRSISIMICSSETAYEKAYLFSAGWLARLVRWLTGLARLGVRGLGLMSGWRSSAPAIAHGISLSGPGIRAAYCMKYFATRIPQTNLHQPDDLGYCRVSHCRDYRYWSKRRARIVEQKSWFWINSMIIKFFHLFVPLPVLGGSWYQAFSASLPYTLSY